jgi:hypothetical protein
VLYTFNISGESSFTIFFGTFGQGCFTTITALYCALCTYAEAEHQASGGGGWILCH